MRKAFFLLALAAAVSTSGCAALSGRRATPDEFQVARNAPLVSFQEVPRKLEQVYLKTMADAQGVVYAA